MGIQYIYIFFLNLPNITTIFANKRTQAKENYIDPVPYFSPWKVSYVIVAETWEYEVLSPDHYLGQVPSLSVLHY
jgi:hypothetical protein